jgi:hypothetical protein
MSVRSPPRSSGGRAMSAQSTVDDPVMRAMILAGGLCGPDGSIRSLPLEDLFPEAADRFDARLDIA